MQLQEGGKLSVNDRACKYIENCPEAWKGITIHHLPGVGPGRTSRTRAGVVVIVVVIGFLHFEFVLILKAQLKLLHLNHKVKVKDGALSTTAVSQGQRKRLALLTAYLEDRPFYLFDEWAADQDPYFKEIFYTQLLPELKARGKTVLVITHDDKYFDLADRIVKLDYGKLDSRADAEGSLLKPLVQV